MPKGFEPVARPVARIESNELALLQDLKAPEKGRKAVVIWCSLA
jgi:hypothetical protein